MCGGHPQPELARQIFHIVSGKPESVFQFPKSFRVGISQRLAECRIVKHFT